MGRPRTFDRDTALEQAMDLFWRHGYESTSVRDLIAHLEISSSSLYTAFGDKRDVYLAALRHYRAVEREQFRALLDQPTPVRDTLAQMADELVAGLAGEEGPRGSFTLNAAVELGGRDEAVAAELRGHFDDISELLSDRLAAAQAAGEITARFSAADLARYLLHGFYSLAVLVKVYPQRERLRQMATVMLAVLDCS